MSIIRRLFGWIGRMFGRKKKTAGITMRDVNATLNLPEELTPHVIRAAIRRSKKSETEVKHVSASDESDQESG